MATKQTSLQLFQVFQTNTSFIQIESLVNRESAIQKFHIALYVYLLLSLANQKQDILLCRDLSALLSYISMREFLRTQEKCIEKHEVQSSAFRTFQAFLKTPKCLHNSTIHKDEVFYFFYKMLRKLRALKLAK